MRNRKHCKATHVDDKYPLKAALEQPYPQTYDEAMLWFVRFAPRSTLKKLVGGRTKTKPRWQVLRKACHQYGNSCSSLYERCALMFQVQLAYRFCEHAQRSFENNELVNSALSDMFDDIPIRVEVKQDPNRPQICTIKPEKNSQHITTSWSILLSQLTNIMPPAKTGDDDVITFAFSDGVGLYTCSRIAPFRKVVILSTKPFNDYVLHYVQKHCKFALQRTLLVSDVQHLILQYIGTVTIFDSW